MEKLKTIAEVKAEKKEELDRDLEALKLKRKAYEISNRFLKVFTFGKIGISNARIVFFLLDEYHNNKYQEPEKEELIEIISKVLKKFPEGTNPYKIGMSDCKGRDNTSPFSLSIKNPSKGRSNAVLRYITKDDIQIQIEFDENVMYNDMLGRETRKVTESEYHYFTGISKREITEMRIPRKFLKGFKFVRFYGGNCTSYSDDESHNEIFKKTITKGIKDG